MMAYRKNIFFTLNKRVADSNIDCVTVVSQEYYEKKKKTAMSTNRVSANALTKVAILIFIT